jgi:type I restriction enzyme, R subunit
VCGLDRVRARCGERHASAVCEADRAAQARHNDFDNFRLVFDKRFINTVVTRMDDNEAIFKKILDDDEFRAILEDFYARKIYDRVRRE